MTQKTEIWAIIKEIYGMGGDIPTSDLQVELVDKLSLYMMGVYKPTIKVNTPQIEDDVEKKVVVMVTQADGSQIPRSRGRPKKA